jgi:hypothetical protein
MQADWVGKGLGMTIMTTVAPTLLTLTLQSELNTGIDEYDGKAIRDFSKLKRSQQEAFHWSSRGCFVDSALEDAVRIIVAAAPAKSPTPTTDPTTRPAMVPVERLSSASLSSSGQITPQLCTHVASRPGSIHSALQASNDPFGHGVCGTSAGSLQPGLFIMVVVHI